MRAKDFTLEAKPLAPLEIPTPAQSTVEKSVKMANHIDKVLDQYEIKKSIIQQEIDRLKDQIEALKYGPPEGSTVKQKGTGWVGRDREGRPIGGGPIDEISAPGVVEGFPNFNREWDEATRYPEFVKLGKKKWIELVSKGKQVTVTRKNVNKINNTDAADPKSFKLLDPEKQKRALAQLANGDVEMPIVARYSDGYLELIGGNTRLTAQMAKDGQAKVWLFNVPEELTQGVAEDQVNGIKLKVHQDDDGLIVKALANGKTLGYAEFFFDEEGNLDPQDLTVLEPYQKQGIAKAMYDHVKSLGYDIVRSWSQTSAGKGFWDKHRGQDVKMWEQGVAENFADGKKPEMNFEEGDCPIFAIALHRLSKLPLMALVEYDDKMGSAVLIHAYVKLNNNWRIDATGETDVDWMLNKYPNSGGAKEIEISERDLIRLGYGKNKCPTLQQVLPHAKEVLQGIELNENFANGKVKGKSRPGRVKRAGASCSGSVTDLRKRAKNASGERAKMYHWCANMKSGRNKS